MSLLLRNIDQILAHVRVFIRFLSWKICMPLTTRTTTNGIQPAARTELGIDILVSVSVLL